MATITANIPARKIGKFSYAAYTQSFEKDENGVWTGEGYGLMLETDVIDICKKASNWADIKTVNFPMLGFHH